MCFIVILDHLWVDQESGLFFEIFKNSWDLPVPVFMIMSFYLTGESIRQSTREQKKKRLWRLVYPQFGWTIIYYLVYRTSDLIYQTRLIHNGIWDLFIQMLTGHKYNETMWYQVDLIIITIMFYALFTMFHEKTACRILIFTICGSFVWEYMGWNYALFNSLTRDVKYTLGRFSEVLPYASMGILLDYYNVCKKLQKHKKISIPLFVVGFFAAVIFKLIIKLPAGRGFGYSGVPLMGMAVCTFIVALLVPFPSKFESINSIITKYTLGIYCMHRLIGYIFTNICVKLGDIPGNFQYCVLVYLFSYLTSLLLSKFPYTRKLVE